MLSAFRRTFYWCFRFFCSSLLLLSCSSRPAPSLLSVKGSWKTADDQRMAYIQLDFADSTALFHVLGDTVLRFTYHLDQPTRAVVLTNGLNRTVSCQVLRANADSLVFANLWDLPTPQRFARD
jgi:hypothetical protein